MPRCGRCALYRDIAAHLRSALRTVLRNSISGSSQDNTNATAAIGTAIRNTVWMVCTMPATTPAWTAGGSVPERLRVGSAQRAVEIGWDRFQVQGMDDVGHQEIGEDGTEHRRAEGATDHAEERRPRGRRTQLLVGHGVLDRDHEDLHDQTQPDPEHEQVAGDRPGAGGQADPATSSNSPTIMRKVPTTGNTL